MSRKGILLVVLLLVAAAPARAIIVCHDYVVYRISGEDPRPPTGPSRRGVSKNDLFRYLKEHDYQPHAFTHAADDPHRAEKVLQPGDVIVIHMRGAHSGYVNARGTIDHFIQVYDASGTAYDPRDLPEHTALDGRFGGLYHDDSLAKFLNRPTYQGPNRQVEVWRLAQGKVAALNFAGTWYVTSPPFKLILEQRAGRVRGVVYKKNPASGRPPILVGRIEGGRVEGDSMTGGRWRWIAGSLAGEEDEVSLRLEPTKRSWTIIRGERITKTGRHLGFHGSDAARDW